MARNNDDAVFGSGKLGDNIMDGKLAFGRVGGERVVLDLIAFEMGEDVVLDLLVICAAQRPRAKGNDVFDVLHGACAVDGGRSGGVSRKGKL